MTNLFELFDSKTDRIVFVGTEAECIAYSVEHPERSFYWEVKRNVDKETSNDY